jgi:putative membrane protein
VGECNWVSAGSLFAIVKVNHSMKVQQALLAGLAVLTAASLIAPPYPQQQWLQHIPTLVVLPTLFWAVRKGLLSTAALACLAAMLALHVIGARWIYSYVPYERWSDAIVGSGPREWFGWTRNHYDRLVHLAFGLLMPLPIVETAMRYCGLSRRWALAGALAAVTAMSAAYEVFEWLLAVVAAPEFADQYNGQQGDGWDAQKDMALAMAGSLAMTAVMAWSRPLAKAGG